MMLPPGFSDFPARQRFVDAGACELMGRAWSGSGHITRVEVSTDGGASWSDAVLGPEPESSSAWRSWSFDWEATPGEHELLVRATDEAGNVQPMDPPWNYGGFMNNMPQRVPVARSLTVRRATAARRSSGRCPSSVLKKCGLIRRPSPRKSVQTSRARSSWQIFSASGPTLTLTTPPRSSLSRGVRTSSPASSARAIRWSVSSPLPRADRRRSDLGDDVDPTLRDEEDRRRRRAVLEATRRGVIVEMLGVEREGLSLREPAGHGGFERGEQVSPRVQEDEPRAAEHPLEDPGRVEVAPEVVEIERDDPEAVVVVDERERASLARDRAHRLRVDDRARAVQDPVEHHQRGSFVDRPVVLLHGDRQPVGAPEPPDLGSGLPGPRDPHVTVGGEVQLGQDHGPPFAGEIEARGDRRQRDRDVGRERHLVRIAPRERGERTLEGRHPREDVLEPDVVGSALRAPRLHVLVEGGPRAPRDRPERRADQVRLAFEDGELVAPIGEVHLRPGGHEPLEPGRRPGDEVEVRGELPHPVSLARVDRDLRRHAVARSAR